MERDKTHMEKVLGQHLAQPGELEIPGLRKFAQSDVLYFLLVSDEQPRALFEKILNFAHPPNAKSGGAVEGRCIITTPKEDRFYAVIFRGDLAGWKKDIELGASSIGSELATIEDSRLVTREGCVFDLAECEVEFF